MSSLNFEMYDSARDVCVSLNAQRAKDTIVFKET